MTTMPTVDEVRTQLDRAIYRAAIAVRTGEGTQAALDDLLERRVDVEGLHTYVSILVGGGLL